MQNIEISDIDLQTCVVYSNAIDTKATPSRARKLVRAGDVLVSTVRPEGGTVGVVGPHHDGSVCTTGLAVLRCTKIDPHTLVHLLKTEFVITQLTRNNVGIVYPAINKSCLLDVLLPIRREDLPRLEQEAKDSSLVLRKIALPARGASNNAVLAAPAHRPLEGQAALSSRQKTATLR